MNKIELVFGDVQNKQIQTSNDFVSHMVEHIAWRMGCSIHLCWESDDWTALGRMLGRQIRSFPALSDTAAALGMMDDGSSEVRLSPDFVGAVEIFTGTQIDKEWFLSQRCEQLASGHELVRLLKGLARGLGMKIDLKVCSFEDPHHTWESVFRGVGIALNRLFSPPAGSADFSSPVETDIQCGDIAIASWSGNQAEIIRHTAETRLDVMVDFAGNRPVEFQYEGVPIAQYDDTSAFDGFRELLEIFSSTAGFSLKVGFRSKVLSSGHVLLEDTGLVIGRALREILMKRMMAHGINGAGSSLLHPIDFSQQKITVGVSVEGRKFWRFVPMNTTIDTVRKSLIIGQTVLNGLFSEDLDDFLDGLSWGLGCSIVIHIKELPSAETAWRMVFENLGWAVAEAFEVNPYRKGVPPGVRANLT
ncbi:MAG: hypothetical protein DSY89_01955 [Deltaproteobacteria bacterium]|nr:MAG: hypothetical protein DSY89_01955 [Deltaproteobacteria bacterium]